MATFKQRDIASERASIRCQRERKPDLFGTYYAQELDRVQFGRDDDTQPDSVPG